MVNDSAVQGRSWWLGVCGHFCPAGFGKQTPQHSSGHARLVISAICVRPERASGMQLLHPDGYSWARKPVGTSNAGCRPTQVPTLIGLAREPYRRAVVVMTNNRGTLQRFVQPLGSPIQESAHGSRWGTDLLTVTEWSLRGLSGRICLCQILQSPRLFGVLNYEMITQSAGCNGQGTA